MTLIIHLGNTTVTSSGIPDETEEFAELNIDADQ
jgi:hypothetical protein